MPSKEVSIPIVVFVKLDFCMGPTNFKYPYHLNLRSYESQILVPILSKQYKSNLFNGSCKFKTYYPKGVTP